MTSVLCPMVVKRGLRRAAERGPVRFDIFRGLEGGLVQETRRLRAGGISVSGALCSFPGPDERDSAAHHVLDYGSEDPSWLEKDHGVFLREKHDFGKVCWGWGYEELTPVVEAPTLGEVTLHAVRDRVSYNHAPDRLSRQERKRIGRVDVVIVAERNVIAHLAAVRRARDVLDFPGSSQSPGI